MIMSFDKPCLMYADKIVSYTTCKDCERYAGIDYKFKKICCWFGNEDDESEEIKE